MVSDRSNGINWRTIAKVAGLTFLAVLAVIFIFWWGASLGARSGYYSAQSAGYASQYPNDTDKRIEQCFTNSDIAAAKQCAQEAVTADRENQRGEHDLQAQREVADWTYYVLVISVLQIPLGVLGLIALVVTIQQGREAIRKAGESNSIALLAQRPWLSVEIVPKMLKRHGAAMRCEIDINVKNLGQSVAKNYCLCFRLKYTPTGDFDEVEKIWEDFSCKKGPNRRVVLPNDTEVYPYWSYENIEFLPWPKGTGDGPKLAIMFVVSVFYQGDLTGDQWHRVDKAIWVARKNAEGRMDAVIAKSFKGVRSDLLVAEPLTNGTLIS